MTGVKRLSVTSPSPTDVHAHAYTHRLAVFKGPCPPGIQCSAVTGDMSFPSPFLSYHFPACVTAPLSSVSVAPVLSCVQSFSAYMYFHNCLCMNAWCVILLCSDTQFCSEHLFAIVEFTDLDFIEILKFGIVISNAFGISNKSHNPNRFF